MNRNNDSDEGDGVFKHAPNWNFNGDKVKFDTNDVSNANDNYGSSSGFVTKSLLEKDVLGKTRRLFKTKILTAYLDSNLFILWSI